MKKNLFSWGVGLCLVLLAVEMSSCSKEETPQPEPTGGTQVEKTQAELEALLTRDTYWRERVYILYMPDNGKAEAPFEKLLADIGSVWVPSEYMEEDLFMGTFFVEPGAGVVRNYVHHTTEAGRGLLGYYRNRFRIEYDDAGRTVYVCSDDEYLRTVNSVVGVPMRMVSWSEDEVVFEAPVKPFIEQAFRLDEQRYDEAGSLYPDMVVGMRIYWTRVTSEVDLSQMANAEPLD